MKEVKIIIEMASDGQYSCYMKEDFNDFGLAGFGATAEEAKNDMLAAYAEIKETLEADGKQVPELKFAYYYDMRSFFNYFDFLNVSKVAKKAGINPSLMRKYAAGIVNAGENQYRKLKAAVLSFAQELQETNF